MSFKYMSMEISNYRRFKESLDIALTGAADHMVHVGYLLMQARDTDILRESGYAGMGEFAQKEYNLSPDQTSRFIAIAERFGDGEGRLRDEWQQYGYTKLSEMLTLPDAVAAAIPPEITRDEIRELKEEVKAEQRITPIEVAIEKAETGAEEKPLLYQFFKEYFRPAEHAEEFARIENANFETPWDEAGATKYDRSLIMDNLAPSGVAILEARIPGKGRFLLSFKGEDSTPSFIDIRANEKKEVSWYEIRNAIDDLAEDNRDSVIGLDAKKIWSAAYGEPFPEKKMEEPAQTVTSTPAKPERKPEKKVKIAPAQKKPEEKEPKKEEAVKVEGTEKAEEAEKAEVAAAPTACQPAEPVDVWDEKKAEEEQRPADEMLREMHGETPADGEQKNGADTFANKATLRNHASSLRFIADALERAAENLANVSVEELNELARKTATCVASLSITIGDIVKEKREANDGTQG